MKFDDLEAKLRQFETAFDFCVPQNFYMIARIDGRGFTRLTKEKMNFEKPFDLRFRDMMVETTRHLMQCGFQVIYGYTQSDEISLLFSLRNEAFSRKTRKYNSILAGEASAKFSLLLGELAAFDCRISVLPRAADVEDYFRWRNEDAHRNALNGYCYWKLREAGQAARSATAMISKKSIAEKNELLFSMGINFNELPNWQKRGIGLYWTEVEKKGFDPIRKIEVITQRKVLFEDNELPMGQANNAFLQRILAADLS